MIADDKSLLIYAPVPLHRRDGAFVLEDQACNGLRLWTESFQKLIVMMPVSPDPAPPNWVPLTTAGENLSRVEIVPLPMAYRPDQFWRKLPKARRIIRDAIGRADMMGFAIGGYFGDWGAVASQEAIKMNRRFYVWTDRVESEVVRRLSKEGSLKQRIKSRLIYPLMARREKELIGKADMGLFHGRETYEAYARYSRNPQIVHDIHLKKADHIDDAALASKVAAAATGPLRIAYVGRAEPMKGALDWMEVIERLARSGTDFQAVWLGEGSDLEAMRQRVAAAGLGDRVRLPGFLRDRTALLAELRAAHVFLFCHKTPESPRVLIEALASGTPIVGYDGAFARELTDDHGGGVLVPLDDVGTLAAAVGDLARDRGRLQGLIRNAKEDSAPYDDISVFRHRCEMIRKYL
jgi:colanic acid/amylovoran biosynthesis glycosyltransferase